MKTTAPSSCSNCGAPVAPRGLSRDRRHIGFGASCVECGWGTFDILSLFDKKRLLEDLRRGEGPRHEDALLVDAGEECPCEFCSLGDIEAMLSPFGNEEESDR